MTVISGDKDGVVWTHLHSLGMARDVPHTKLIVLPDVGHGPHHADPALVTAEIQALQRGLGESRPILQGHAPVA